MGEEADIPNVAGRAGVGRRLTVMFLFGLSLALLFSAGLIEIPNSSSSYDPDSTLQTLALVSALAMLVVSLAEREARLLLGVLLAALGATLLLLKLGGVYYRFISESDEGATSMMLIALLVGAAILWSTAAIRPAGRDTSAEASRRYPGLKEFAAIALHASVALAAFAASVPAVDSRSPGAKAGYSLLAVLAAMAWTALTLYGLFIWALFASGYEP